ncbi:hypothetical protein L598_000100000920 [Mesorhizobium sp. J18]|nr:hypothetical protein L598_000100000920 [Mesorhizobium sp. J18]
MLSAARRSTSSRWRSNRAVRLHMIEALVMRNHMPSRSAIVIWPMVALEESTPCMPEILICRFGVESWSSMKERKKERSSSGVS